MSPLTCPPPRAAPSPRRRLPPFATDCHFHVMGPFDQYPLDPSRAYTPPETPLTDYLDVAEAIGVERMVVVQPSVFGTDNTCTLNAVDLLGSARARAVVVVAPDTGVEALRELHRLGARGVRFNFVSYPDASLAALRTLAPALADLGWHAQVYPSGDMMPELARMAGSSLPVTLVLDHMAGLGPGQGPGNAAFEATLDLLVRERAYVKLSAYRSSRQGPPYDDVAPIARAFIEAVPGRCLWGTDWPHPDMRRQADVPDDGVLVDVLLDWLGDDVTARKVLIDNPAKFYGFTTLYQTP